MKYTIRLAFFALLSVFMLSSYVTYGNAKLTLDTFFPETENIVFSQQTAAISDDYVLNQTWLTGLPYEAWQHYTDAMAHTAQHLNMLPSKTASRDDFTLGDKSASSQNALSDNIAISARMSVGKIALSIAIFALGVTLGSVLLNDTQHG